MAKELREIESKTDIAYRILLKSAKEKSFYEIWEKVKAELKKTITDEAVLEKLDSDDDISFFYTNLTLDGRFVCVGDNKWTLRERVTFDKINIDMNEFYGEDEEEEEEEVEEEEEDSSPEEYEDDYNDSTGTDTEDVIKFKAEEDEDE